MVPLDAIKIDLPSWIWQIDGLELARPNVEDQMELVLHMVERNIADGGGPFAAAVFDADGHLVAPGVNRVVPSSAPIAHAEMVAIAAAGQRLGTWDMGTAGTLQLVSSTEPCAMCLGAVPWSGVKSLVTGARDADARAVGFDEGDKMENWVELLEARGITVKRDVSRQAAAALLESYATSGGDIYNG